MKLKVIITSVLLVVFSSGLTYIALKGFPWVSKQQSRTQEVKENPENIAIRKMWEEIKNDTKFRSCLQAKNDMEIKGNEMLPLYKQNLVKEKDGKSLTKQEAYNTFLYSYFTNRANDYSTFTDFTNNEPSQRDIDTMKNLLSYIYCPDVSKIALQIPATVDTCIQITSTWMRPFEIPEQGNFKVQEEFELAKQQFINGQIEGVDNIKGCCAGTSDSRVGQCPRVRVFMN